ncbi:OLC1v1011779C1 [Oldenlandia corymbosa var. corymbosa]|uniref:OLC1v1011779C1 n=1 Tax=Oldenlandia corymbosa var. corymbosa TaxID=529605 RepID=A0AAV1DUM2_OLDCO|nr:OLC1v1011779C1 [Oldenlandia corymbosa var. corymbosa]
MEKGNGRSPVNAMHVEQNNHTRIGNSPGDGLPPDFITPGGSQGDNNPWGHQTYRWYHHPRLDLPVFSGDEPQNWLRKCRKYSQMHHIPEAEMVDSVELFLDGKADTWFQGVKTAYGVVNGTSLDMFASSDR